MICRSYYPSACIPYVHDELMRIYLEAELARRNDLRDADVHYRGADTVLPRRASGLCVDGPTWIAPSGSV